MLVMIATAKTATKSVTMSNVSVIFCCKSCRAMLWSIGRARGISEDSSTVTRNYVNTFSLLLVLEPRSYSLCSQILLQLDMSSIKKKDRYKYQSFFLAGSLDHGSNQILPDLILFSERLAVLGFIFMKGEVIL